MFNCRQARVRNALVPILRPIPEQQPNSRIPIISTYLAGVSKRQCQQMVYTAFCGCSQHRGGGYQRGCARPKSVAKYRQESMNK